MVKLKDSLDYQIALGCNIHYSLLVIDHYQKEVDEFNAKIETFLQDFPDVNTIFTRDVSKLPLSKRSKKGIPIPDDIMKKVHNYLKMLRVQKEARECLRREEQYLKYVVELLEETNYKETWNKFLQDLHEGNRIHFRIGKARWFVFMKKFQQGAQMPEWEKIGDSFPGVLVKVQTVKENEFKGRLSINDRYIITHLIRTSTCKFCGRMYSTVNRNQKYCQPDCKNNAHNRRRNNPLVK